MDIRHLRIVDAIVRHGTMTRAAERLHVTQPALSRIVKRLEDEVGAPLFERHSKGMQLTAIGQALLPHASLLQHEADYAREEINAMRGLSKGTIRVGAVGSIASYVLPLAVGTLVARWPNLRVEILEGVWDRLAEGLVKHEIDLALSMAMPDTDEIIAIADCRWEDASFVVASPEHALRDRPGLTLADIDVFEYHEAFAGQILANMNALNSEEFSTKQMGLKTKVGRAPRDLPARRSRCRTPSPCARCSSSRGRPRRG